VQIDNLPPKGADPIWTWEYDDDKKESWYPNPGFTGEERTDRTEKWGGEGLITREVLRLRK
jgi:hypothetical protein